MEQNESIRYNVDAVKDRLTSYRDLQRDIENLEVYLDRIETRLYTVGSPSISDMPKAHNSDNDKMNGMVAEKFEIEDELEEKRQLQMQERAELTTIIRKLKQPDERAVIRLRYFSSGSWDDVNDALFGGKSDFMEREDTYLRRTHRVHGCALVNIAKILGLVLPLEPKPAPETTNSSSAKFPADL